jgi:cell division protein FtsW (lipid II flippase)
MAILVLHALIIQRGLKTALDVRDWFARLLAGGLAYLFAWQVCVITGSVARLIPGTGLPAPSCPRAAPRSSPPGSSPAC